MPDQIFISYRRDDAAYVTGHINDLLRKEFGNESVFTDVDNIALGVDFRAVLDESVSQCQVLLAVIGDNWLTVRSRDGKPRLHDPADFVRIEIESALKRNIPVIPLLVSGATMPLEEDLPGSLKDLAFRNGTQIRPAPDFNLDVDRLIRNLRAYLRSMREDAGDDQAAPDANQSDETEQQPAQIDSEFGQDAEAKASETSAEKMLVGEEESARKQVELAVGHQPPKKRWAARLWLITILAVVGGSWYYASQNPEKIQAVLTAIQTESAEVDDNLVSEDAEVNRLDDTDSAEVAGEAAIGAPTSFTAATIAAADEDSTADPAVSTITVDATEDSITDLTASTTIVDATEDSITDLTVSTTPVDGAEASITDLTVSTITVDDAEAPPELTADSTSETSDNTDAPNEAAEVDLAENVENESAAAAGMVDGEVILTPETQRRANVSKFLSEGVSLAAIGDHDAAIQKFDEAIQLDAEAPFLYKQRGASFQTLGQYAAAVSDYDEAVRLNGEDLNAYYNRGASHFAMQDYAASVADYDEVIRLDPELADAYSKRADAHEAMGSLAEAARDRATATVFESNRENPR